jgi:AraC-like DNA-binding protein
MTSSLPLIRLSAANPFLLELESRSLDARQLLRDLDLPENIPASSEIFVASSAMYRIVEKAAELAKDPYFGFGIGQRTELTDWSPIALAAESATNVGDLLNHFIVNALDHSSSTRFYLRTEGDKTTFGFRRLAPSPVLPAQNDAFYLGLLIKLLMNAANTHWDAESVLFKVADPAAVPPLSDNIRIAKGDVMGTQAVFPSLWLFDRLERTAFQTAKPIASGINAPESLIDALHLALLPHMHEANLSVDRAARICGYERRRLSAKLRSKGTTLRKEIANIRETHARNSLLNTGRRIADIGQSVGFTDPTIFSRAFKNWTGQSPQEFRRTHRQ